MTAKPTQNPQHGPARALLELLIEYPELPALTWSIGADGVLRGHLNRPDASPEAQLWADALGYTLREPFGYRYNDADMEFQCFHMMWRDVSLALSFYSDEPVRLACLAVAA